MIQKFLSHRKVSSNQTESAQYLSQQSLKSDKLLKTLASLKVLKGLVQPIKQRIRTEGDKVTPHKNTAKLSIIKSLLAKSNRSNRGLRNQSADFQSLLQPSKSLLRSNKKKVNSYGSMGEQNYFTQRLDAEKVLFATNRYLTTTQFKERLQNYQSTSGNKSTATDKVRKKSSEQTTLKKGDDQIGKVLINLSKKRIRTETSQPSSRLSFVVIDEEPTGLEKKIDILAHEVQQLKKKSDQLELQNRMLFENLSKIQSERPTNRNQLLQKIDQMIMMQKKQEENLNFFKNVFQGRRIKTDQDSRRDSGQRPLVKSEYQGFNI